MIESAVTRSKAKAAETGAVYTELMQMQAAMPGLKATIANLKKLAPKATYTEKGKFWNGLVKQTGFGATEGATAREEFISIISNQVLPLLRPTFGAAFTVAEGDSLRATMGDPDMAPASKFAWPRLLFQ